MSGPSPSRRSSPRSASYFLAVQGMTDTWREGSGKVDVVLRSTGAQGAARPASSERPCRLDCAGSLPGTTLLSSVSPAAAPHQADVLGLLVDQAGKVALDHRTHHLRRRKGNHGAEWQEGSGRRVGPQPSLNQIPKTQGAQYPLSHTCAGDLQVERCGMSSG